MIAGAWLYARNASLGLLEMRYDHDTRLAGQWALSLGSAAPNRVLAALYPNTELERFYANILSEVDEGPLTSARSWPTLSSTLDEPAKPLPFVAGSGVIDIAEWQKGAARGRLRNDETTIPRDARVTLAGWALDPVAGVPARGVLLALDGTPDPNIRVAYGFPRPDVAKALPGDFKLATGFRATFNVARLGPGPHTLDLGAARWDRLGSYPIDRPITFIIARRR